MQEKKLIDAHIYPRFFYEPLMNFLIDETPYPKRSPIGAYDKYILCGSCDSSVIGKEYDDYAKRVLLDQEGVISQIFSDASGKINVYKLIDKAGYDRITRFFISILWRASVSQRDEFKGINLGPLEKFARQAILDFSYDYSKYFEVSIFYFKSLNTKVNLIPTKRIRLNKVNFYILSLGYFKVYIKCDSRPYPVEVSPLVVSAQNDILMIEDNISFHDEYGVLYEMADKLANWRKNKILTDNGIVAAIP
jgi:hypothetical protein